ncbi:MAG: phosphatase PAP2 family protein [Planctomycetota bacterium]
MAVDRVWWMYALAVVGVAVAFAPRGAESAIAAYAGIHVLLAATLVVLRRTVDHRGGWTPRLARGGFTMIAMPIAFQSLSLVLPAVHPEPWEWTWIAADRALFGVDPTVALQPLLRPWLVEILQWAYVAFYAVPIVTVVGLGWRLGGEAFDDALHAVTFCFLLSYLGYFLWPTLPPYRFLPHGPEREGVWLAASIRGWIDAAEWHRWDCFPSGHTMLSVACLVIARPVRPLVWGLAPLVLAIVVSTVALRYHYASDVLVGALLVGPALWLGRRCR